MTRQARWTSLSILAIVVFSAERKVGAVEEEREVSYAKQLETVQSAFRRSKEKLAELEKALRKDPDNVKLRRRVARQELRTGIRRRMIEIHAYLVQVDEAGEDRTARRVARYARDFARVLDTTSWIQDERRALRKIERLQAQTPDDSDLRDEVAANIEIREEYVEGIDRLRAIMLDGEVEEEDLDDDDERGERVEAQMGRLRRQREFLKLRGTILEHMLELHEAQKKDRKTRIVAIQRSLNKLRIEAGLEDLDGPLAPEDGAKSPLVLSEEQRSKAGDADFDKKITPLFREHCFDCHNEKEHEAELNLVAELRVQPIVRRIATWRKVIAHVKGRVMPPEDDARMSDDERRLIVGYFEDTIANFDYSQIDDPGFEGARRLTHIEYNNTVRDLLQTDIRPADAFPSELSGSSGFDNSGNTLFLHRLLMERYLGAAEAAALHALPDVAKTDAQRKSRRRILFMEPGDDVDEVVAVKNVIHAFLRRAYRRDPSNEELAVAIAQYRSARDTGRTYAASIRSVVERALVSPKFLMRLESWTDGEEAFRISHWDMASRLSYFLWSSMPDDELLHLAREERLHDPAVIRAQIARMLADPKSLTLGTVFAAQWLGSQHLGERIRPDPIDNPWCTDSLMESLKAETALFFHSLVLDDAPISRLVDADYTFLNEETAKHYGIEGVRGENMRRVDVSDSSRGGLFAQGSLLAITSFPGRTSPVVRGKWILSEVLGTPPPPPPPDVSEFSEEVAESRFLTPRQKLKLHRRNPTCYACHSQIDPLGFSLEGYDWFGRVKRTRRGKPIDVRGKLPNGTEFEGLAGLKRVIVEERLDDLTRQLARKMLSYALGRQLEYFDEPAVRAIVDRTLDQEYRLGAMVEAIVESYPFQYKKNRPQTVRK